jgi:hypothetical protein
MILINETYVKKVDGSGKVKPFKIVDGYVHFSHVGYFDWRKRTEESFLEIYELESEHINEITHDTFMKALKAKADAELIISKYNLQESKKLVKNINDEKWKP